VAATASTELPLLVSLSTLLPIAAVLVIVITFVFLVRKLRQMRHAAKAQQRRDASRVG